MALRLLNSVARIGRGLLAICAVTAMSFASAENAKPVRILVGFPAGGGTDIVARFLADKLKDELGAPVLVENRPGAGGQIAAQVLKAAPTDGTVLFLTNDHTVAIIPLVMKNPGFNTEKDFAPVAGVAGVAMALALSAGSPLRNFDDYIAWMRKEKTGAVGVPAPSSLPEFMVKAIGEKNGLDLVPVPYRGAAPMVSDMLGNQISAGMGSVNDFVEPQKAGKIRIVAFAGTARHFMFPDVPTFSELGVSGFQAAPFYGIYVPAGTPKAVVDRLSDAVRKVLAISSIRERLMAQGLTVEYMNPQQLGAREHAYAQAWGSVIKASGFVPQ
jgi:tripartite-type tricarboxylate transporter receptor subunit TctC